MTEQKSNKPAAVVLEYRIQQVEKRFDKFEANLSDRLDKSDSKIDALLANFITHKEADAILRKAELEHKMIKDDAAASEKAMDRRISGLEAIVRWGGLVIAGAVLTAILSIVIPGVNR